MNPEKDLTPQEKEEMRLTALLMGELPPVEEKEVRAQLAADPALAVLHERLRKALELLREAKDFPDHPAPPTPLQLSSERRERLLAHFQTPAPAPAPTPIVAMPRRDWSWVIPMGIAAALVLFLGAGLLINGGLVQRNAASGISDPRASGYRWSRIFNGQEQTPDFVTAPEGHLSDGSEPERDAKAPHKALVAMGSATSQPPGKEVYGRLENQAGIVFENRASGVPNPSQNLADAVSLGGTMSLGPATLTPASASETLASNGPNRIYLGGQAVLTPVPIPGGDSISLQTRDSGGSANKSNLHISYGDASHTVIIPKASADFYGGGPLTGGTILSPADSLAAQSEYQRYPGHPMTTSLGAPFESFLGNEQLYTITPRSGTTGLAKENTPDFDTGIGRFPDGPFAGKQDGNGSTSKYSAGTPVITGNTKTLSFKPTVELKSEQASRAPNQNVFTGGGTVGTSPALNTADYPFAAAGASPASAASAAGSVTAGNRSGNIGISANAIDALVFPTTDAPAATSGGARGASAGSGNDSSAPALPQAEAAPRKPAPDDRSHPKKSVAVEEVKQLFTEAQGFYDTGRYDLAKKRSEQILNVDPYSIAARRMQEKADEKMKDYGVAAYNESRASAISETDRAWQRPLRRFNTAVPGSDGKDSQAASTKKIRQKLERIIIPKMEFRDATVQEAIEFLKKKSVELDDASPPGEKGTNIVLKVPPSPSAPPAAPAVPGIPGLEKPAAANPEDARITVSLTNIPMIEALKYVTGLANLKFKVEPYAVSVVPVTESTDVLMTKEWTIEPDLIPRAPGAGGDSKSTSRIADQESAKNWLIANGVSFNGAASAIYIPRSHRLIVRDTEDQLDLVDTVVNSGVAPEPPTQAETKPDVPPKKEPEPAAIPQPEIQTSANAFSTFSLNVSDVSFKLAAASLEQGKMPEPGSVRSEEFINAFDYRDPEAGPGAPLAFATERARYPFAQNRDLLRFALKTAAAGRQPGRPLNIVLLLDKSGSMERADRVNIVREALRVLTSQLQPQDKLSIITFARTPRLWADGLPGDRAGEMIARVGEITPEGGTNLEAALDLGYQTALRHHETGNISRVVLFTDGAANLGDVKAEALKQKVETHRKQGVALDCFGIGWEGYNDDLLEELTRHGDGRYGFINTPEEATVNFAAQLAGALHVAAADVKVQVEFNPRRVTAYRQIGYAKHQLTKEQLRDNTVDAAEIGAEESGNALYVVEVNPSGEGDLATVRVRFKVPGTSDYREHEWTVPFTGNVPPLEQASPALRLAGTAAAFSEMLAANPYAAEVTSDRLLGLVNGVPAVFDPDLRPTKLEWMIRQAKNLTGH